jgi:hypothetical protein
MSAITFTAYDINTGVITKIGAALDPFSQIEENESFILGRFSGDKYYIDLSTRNPVLISGEEFEQKNLNRFKSEALVFVMALIKRARERFITNLPGQDAIYQAKEAEAIAYINAENPVLSEFPLLSAEVGITANTAIDLANLWITMANQWRNTAAQLESIRMTANIAINSATTEAEIEAALDNLRSSINNL